MNQGASTGVDARKDRTLRRLGYRVLRPDGASHWLCATDLNEATQLGDSWHFPKWSALSSC
jgi:hypothetical protein